MLIAKPQWKTTALWLFFILFTFQPVQANERVILQLKWMHQFQFAGFYAAQTQGYFAEEGLDVEIKEADLERTPLDTVLSGDAQYGISDSSLVLARMQGMKPVILATIFQHSPLVLLTLKSSGIINPLELRGKKVMYLRNNDDAVLRAMFTEIGLTPNDYVHVPHSFNDDDLTHHQVDAISAYITDQPFSFKNKNIPINIISPSNYGIDFYGDMIFVEENYFKENTQQALAFRRAAIKGWHYAITHQEEMVDWIITHLKPNKSKANLMYEAKMTSRIIQADIVDLGYFSTNRFLRIADIYKKLNIVDSNADFDGINYQDYLNSPIHERQWVQATILISIVLALSALILWVNNLLLKGKVKDKAFHLEKANYSMKRYLNVINQYINACILSPELTFLDASSAWCRTLKKSSKDLMGKEFKELLHDMSDESYTQMRNALNNDSNWSGEIQLSNQKGHSVWFDISAQIEKSEDNHLNEITVIAIDISDKKRIEQLSLTDSLTGLANRRHFDNVFKNEFLRMKRSQSSISLLMIDVDYFKQYNDFYGHQKGDACLQVVSKMLATCAKRPADLAVRYGGEEFILLLPGIDIEGAYSIAQSALDKMKKLNLEHKASSVSLSVTLSIGIASTLYSEISTTEEVINLADQQLYKAKSSGRNQISSTYLPCTANTYTPDKNNPGSE